MCQCHAHGTHACAVFVLDEADRMLDMGFEREMRAICALIRAGDRGAQVCVCVVNVVYFAQVFARAGAHDDVFSYVAAGCAQARQRLPARRRGAADDRRRCCGECVSVHNRVRWRRMNVLSRSCCATSLTQNADGADAGPSAADSVTQHVRVLETQQSKVRVTVCGCVL
jgi:hypothetical protein